MYSPESQLRHGKLEPKRAICGGKAPRPHSDMPLTSFSPRTGHVLRTKCCRRHMAGDKAHRILEVRMPWGSFVL